jgi:hunchback-like protein
VQVLTSSGHEVSTCVHCELLFGDRTLYQLHMGLHNVNDPWQCNACGLVCSSRLHFATHSLHY